LNIIFWILVLVALVCVWFCLSGIFRAVGRFISAIIRDTTDRFKMSEVDAVYHLVVIVADGRWADSCFLRRPRLRPPPPVKLGGMQNPDLILAVVL